MKFIDDKSNKLSWWNRNYFYVGTLIVIAINVLIFTILGQGSAWIDETLYKYNYGSILDLRNLFNAFVAKFGHGSWIHLFGNCLGTAIAGLYLERKTGSINFLLLTLSGCVLSAMAQVCMHLAIPAGFSCVTFFLFACLIVDYIFSFEKTRRNKTNIILGAILLVVIYINQMCLDFNNGIIFYAWPYQLLTNPGHYSGFIAGLIVGLIINITRLKMSKQSIPDLKTNISKKAKKIVYSCVASFMGVISILCLTLSLVANSRRSITVNFYTQNGYSAIYKVNDKKSDTLEEYLKDYWKSLDPNYFDENYAVQFFTDKTYSKKNVGIWEFEPNHFGYSEHKIYPYIGNFVPLTKPTTQNYYVKAFKCYGINFTGNLTYNFEYVKNLVNHSIIPANYYYYSSTAFKAWDFVEQGKDFSFKLDYAQGKNVVVTYKNDKDENITVNADQNGVYTIEKVSQDLVINLQY